MTAAGSARPLTRTAARRRAFSVAVCLLAASGCASISRAPQPAPPPAAPAPAPPETATKVMRFEATAYSLDGTTRSGSPVRKGIVAADPKVLPLGTRIRVNGAGGYSGEYTVADTGRTIRGREIDIFIANDAEAKRFGRKQVEVEVLESTSESRGADHRANP